MRKFFAIKGIHNVDSIFEINGKAYISTGEGTLKLKDNLHSNTFLIESTPIKKIYDTEKLNYNEIYKTMTPTTFLEAETIIRSGTDIELLNEKEIDYFRKKFYLIDNGNCLVRPNLDECIKTIQYMQLLPVKNEEEFNSQFKLQSNLAKKWVMEHFLFNKGPGFNILLAFFILIKSQESKNLNEFNMNFKILNCDSEFEILNNIDELVKFVMNSFLDSKSKDNIKEFLHRLK